MQQLMVELQAMARPMVEAVIARGEQAIDIWTETLDAMEEKILHERGPDSMKPGRAHEMHGEEIPSVAEMLRAGAVLYAIEQSCAGSPYRKIRWERGLQAVAERHAEIGEKVNDRIAELLGRLNGKGPQR